MDALTPAALSVADMKQLIRKNPTLFKALSDGNVSALQAAVIPRVTTANLPTGLGTAGKGYEVFDTTVNKKKFWNGTAWETVTSA